MFLSKKIVTLQGSITKLSIYQEASNYDSNGTYITTFILNTQKVSSTNTRPPRLHENDKLIISGTINEGTLKSYAYRNLTKKSSFYGHFFWYPFKLIILLYFLFSTFFTMDVQENSMENLFFLIPFFITMLMLTISSIDDIIQTVKANIALYRFNSERL